jgi:uncharacterized phiE125 gp8 family phage protein
MALVIQTEPTQEPISLEETKQHLRVDIEDDDSLILNLIVTARQYAETVTHRALISQTWKYYLDEWPDCDYIELPFPPLQTVSSVKYTDYNLTTTTMTVTTEYVVETNKEPGRVVLAYGATWPTATLHVTSPIEIIYTCGYGTPDDVPQSLKSAMLIDLADLYENRESIITGQPVSHLDVLTRLYQPYRIFKF